MVSVDIAYKQPLYAHHAVRSGEDGRECFAILNAGPLGTGVERGQTSSVSSWLVGDVRRVTRKLYPGEKPVLFMTACLPFEVLFLEQLTYLLMTAWLVWYLHQFCTSRSCKTRMALKLRAFKALLQFIVFIF